MRRLIAAILIMMSLMGCSTTGTNAGTREVPTTTMQMILSEQNFKDLIYTFDAKQDKLMKTWLKDFLIPYVSHLETELQHSIPTN